MAASIIAPTNALPIIAAAAIPEGAAKLAYEIEPDAESLLARVLPSIVDFMVLRALLDAGVQANARYDNDLTALMWAAAYGHDATVALLVERGADANARDNRGKTALDMAEEGGYRKTVDMLRAAAKPR